jgi:hypothetical protein
VADEARGGFDAEVLVARGRPSGERQDGHERSLPVFGLVGVSS